METLRQEQLGSSTTPDEIIIPSSNIKLSQEDKDMMDTDITDAISGSTVKKLLIPEDAEMELPNYVLDYTTVEQTSAFQKQAIKNLLSTDGKVAIYLYTDGRILKIGYGEEYKLNQIIDSFRANVADENVKVYKDVEIGKELREVRHKDISKMRFNI